jgi:hypothetical protein
LMNGVGTVAGVLHGQAPTRATTTTATTNGSRRGCRAATSARRDGVGDRSRRQRSGRELGRGGRGGSRRSGRRARVFWRGGVGELRWQGLGQEEGREKRASSAVGERERARLGGRAPWCGRAFIESGRERRRGGMWPAMAPLMTINGGETAPLKRWQTGEAASRRLGGCGWVVQDFGRLELARRARRSAQGASAGGRRAGAVGCGVFGSMGAVGAAWSGGRIARGRLGSLACSACSRESRGEGREKPGGWHRERWERRLGRGNQGCGCLGLGGARLLGLLGQTAARVSLGFVFFLFLFLFFKFRNTYLNNHKNS